MGRRAPKEMTVEEFDDWSAASDRVRGGRQSGGRGGRAEPVAGARDRAERGLADRPAAARRSDSPARCCSAPPPSLPVPATPFDGIPLEDSRKRLAGWSAERQRLFLRLAETGSVHLASRRRAPLRALGLSAARPLAGLRRGLGHGRPARRRAAVRHRLRSRDQRPHRAGLAGGRAGRGEARAERQAADVAAGPARSPPLRRAVGAARRRRSPGRGRGSFLRRCSTRSPTRHLNSTWPVRTFAKIGRSRSRRSMRAGVARATCVGRGTAVRAPHGPAQRPAGDQAEQHRAEDDRHHAALHGPTRRFPMLAHLREPTRTRLATG